MPLRRVGSRSVPTRKARPAAGVRLALVGCGAMGHVHARDLLGIAEAEVAAICDPAGSALTHMLKHVFSTAEQRPATYRDYRRLLDTEKLDGVILVTPHRDHYVQTRDALDAGLHVLCEKPLVIHHKEAHELVNRAARARRLLSVGFNGPMTREFAYVRQLLKRGGLGRIQYAHAYVRQDWGRVMADTWRQDPKLSGGGFLFDTGAHLLNALQWLMDEPATEVFAALDHCGRPVEINAALTMKFANGCLVSVAAAGSVPGGIDSTLSLHGTRGMVTTGVWGGKLEHSDGQGEIVRYPAVPDAPLRPARDFVNAILGRDELRCPGRYGLWLAGLMEAVYASAATGKPVRVRAE